MYNFIQCIFSYNTLKKKRYVFYLIIPLNQSTWLWHQLPVPRSSARNRPLCSVEGLVWQCTTKHVHQQIAEINISMLIYLSTIHQEINVSVFSIVLLWNSHVKYFCLFNLSTLFIYIIFHLEYFHLWIWTTLHRLEKKTWKYMYSRLHFIYFQLNCFNI